VLGLEIVGQHDVIIGDDHESPLKQRFGEAGDRAVLRRVSRDRDRASFGKRLLGKILVALFRIDHPAVRRIRPACIGLYGRRLHQFSGMKKQALRFDRLLHFLIDEHHVRRRAGLDEEFVQVRRIAVPDHLRVVEAAAIAHQREQVGAIEVPVVAAMRAVMQDGLDLLASRTIRRLRAQHRQADVVGVRGISVKLWRVFRKLGHAIEQISTLVSGLLDQRRVRRIAIHVIRQLQRLPADLRSSTAQALFGRVVQAEDHCPVVGEARQRIPHALDIDVVAGDRAPLFEAHAVLLRKSPGQDREVGHVADRHMHIAEVDAPRLHCQRDLREFAGAPDVVADRAFVPPAVIEHTLAKLIDDSVASCEEPVGRRQVLHRQGTVEGAADFRQVPVVDCAQLGFEIDCLDEQADRLLDLRAVLLGHEPRRKDHVVRHRDVLKEVPLLHKTLVAGAQRRWITLAWIAQPLQKCQHLLCILLLAGELIRIPARHQAVLVLRGEEERAHVVHAGEIVWRPGDRRHVPAIGGAHIFVARGLGPGIFLDLVTHFLPALGRVKDVGMRKLPRCDESERRRRGRIAVRDGLEHLLLMPAFRNARRNPHVHHRLRASQRRQLQRRRLDAGRHRFPTVFFKGQCDGLRLIGAVGDVNVIFHDITRAGGFPAHRRRQRDRRRTNQPDALQMHRRGAAIKELHRNLQPLDELQKRRLRLLKIEAAPRQHQPVRAFPAHDDARFGLWQVIEPRGLIWNSNERRQLDRGVVCEFHVKLQAPIASPIACAVMFPSQAARVPAPGAVRIRKDQRLRCGDFIIGPQRHDRRWAVRGAQHSARQNDQDACCERHTFHHVHLTTLNVRCTGWAVFISGSIERPHCHATTVTFTGNFARGGIAVNLRVSPSTISAGPSRT
jgi:hypothetical protein